MAKFAEHPGHAGIGSALNETRRIENEQRPIESDDIHVRRPLIQQTGLLGVDDRLQVIEVIPQGFHAERAGIDAEHFARVDVSFGALLQLEHLMDAAGHFVDGIDRRRRPQHVRASGHFLTSQLDWRTNENTHQHLMLLSLDKHWPLLSSFHFWTKSALEILTPADG